MTLTCDGNSTKSRGTRVPLKYGYFTSENMPCSAWPNSWNVVVTSSQVSSVGLPTGGLGMLRWLAIRSEEHTSELQSLMRISYAVFCLKKKKQTKTQPFSKYVK